MKKEGYESHEEYLLSLQQGSWAYMSRCLRMLKDISDAHYIFLNDVCNITSCIPLRKESKIFQLWHACGAFKKFGMSTADLIFGDSRKNQEKFSAYRSESVQDFRFFISQKIQEQIFYVSFVKNIETGIKSTWLVNAIKRLVGRQGYHL